MNTGQARGACHGVAFYPSLLNNFHLPNVVEKICTEKMLVVPSKVKPFHYNRIHGISIIHAVETSIDRKILQSMPNILYSY